MATRNDRLFDIATALAATGITSVSTQNVLLAAILQALNFPDLISGAATTVPAGWVDNGDGTYTADGTQLSQLRWEPIGVIDTVVYDVTFSILAFTSGGLASKLNGTTQGASHASVGAFTDQYTAVANDGVQLIGNDFIGTVSNVIVRQSSQVLSNLNRNTLLAECLIARGGTPFPGQGRNSLLGDILTTYNPSFILTDENRNELLFRWALFIGTGAQLSADMVVGITEGANYGFAASTSPPTDLTPDLTNSGQTVSYLGSFGPSFFNVRTVGGLKIGGTDKLLVTIADIGMVNVPFAWDIGNTRYQGNFTDAQALLTALDTQTIPISLRLG
jgi:hypothetical protein